MMAGMEHLWPWLGFAGLVAALLALDLGVFHRRTRAPSVLESLGWTIAWVILAAVFGAMLWQWRGPTAGLEYFTGYLVEWSLSMDNVFVFVVIFRAFGVDPRYQYRVLFWGILGAVVMRLGFILLGAELVHRFEWVLPLFGLFLCVTAVQLATRREGQIDPRQNWLLRLAQRRFSVAEGDHGPRFFARREGRWLITPLFLVLLVIESTDILFAVDSIPAIFGVTKNAFVIFTSNIFAILGLRALYFLLAAALGRFRYLPYGLSAVLGLIGVKMIAEYWTAPLLPTWASLAAVAGLLGLSIAASLWYHPRRPLDDGEKEGNS